MQMLLGKVQRRFLRVPAKDGVSVTLIADELAVLPIGRLLAMNLAIPAYQRPYRWSPKSVSTLFGDAYSAFTNDAKEYRFGSIILHRTAGTLPNQYTYQIVDGQQRITTLAILLYELGIRENRIFSERYSESSHQAILSSLNILSKRVGELADNNEKVRFRDFLVERCTVVIIVTDSEQEAFQFFDSQNSRGKALKPHDLLKSYHLREMHRDPEAVKLELISAWEDANQNALEDLFRSYLYPATQWYRNHDGQNYATPQIDHFKGIKPSNKYNYAIYHKASNIFVEQINVSGSSELLDGEHLNQFQLTQPIIAGRRFFQWTLHYQQLLDEVKRKITSSFDARNAEVMLPSKRAGDIYVKQLFETALMFFADRFGIDAIDTAVMNQLYTWCYSLRLVMKAVYPATVNKYALGKHDRINTNIDMFAKMSEISSPSALKEIVFSPISSTGIDPKYSEIFDFIERQNKW